MFASSLTTSSHGYLPTPAASPPRPGPSRAEQVSDRPRSKTDTLPPHYLTLFPNGRPDQVSNAPPPQALRTVHTPPPPVPQTQAVSPAAKASPVLTVVTSASGSNARSGVEGWHRYRNGPAALPHNAPELHHERSGVLPKESKDELEQVLELLGCMDLKSIKAARHAQEQVDKAKTKLEALQRVAPGPSAPMGMMVAGALFDDSGTDIDVVQHKAISSAKKKLARLEKELEGLTQKFKERAEAVNLAKLKQEAKIRAETLKSSAKVS